MYIIAGLGNPGKKYVGTRHNMGFEALDAVAAKYGIDIKKAKFNALYGEGTIEGEKVVLVKPQTFMNLSGQAVREFKSWYKTENSQIIIIYDDVSLPVGKMRIRPKGSAGGHNGIKSIIQELGSQDFPRVKIGVGAKPNPQQDLADWVLSGFNPSEKKALEAALPHAADAALSIVEQGVSAAANKYNGFQP